MFPKGGASRQATHPGKDNTMNKRRPQDTRFFEGWDFKSWPEAITAAALIIIISMAVVAGMVWMFVSADRAAYEYTATTTYWVEQGDTLWKIAREYSTDKQDVRRVIDIIEELNDTGATIYPGDCLTVPVFYK